MFFSNLGKLDLLIVVWFYAQANFCFFPGCLEIIPSIQKQSKMPQKIITLLHQFKYCETNFSANCWVLVLWILRKKCIWDGSDLSRHDKFGRFSNNWICLSSCNLIDPTPITSSTFVPSRVAKMPINLWLDLGLNYIDLLRCLI